MSIVQHAVEFGLDQATQLVNYRVRNTDRETGDKHQTINNTVDM